MMVSPGSGAAPMPSRRITCFSPLGGGLLTGKYNDGVPDDSRIMLKGYEWLREIFESEDGQQRLDVERRSRLLHRLAPGAGNGVRQILGAMDGAHSFAAAAGHGLDQHREADLLGLVADALEVGDGLDDGDNEPQVARRRRPRGQDAAALLNGMHCRPPGVFKKF